jgi:hypothetical protein
MLLTGRIKLVEQQGDKEVVIDDNKDPVQTCTDEQRKKVKELIAAYVAASPPPHPASAEPAPGKGAPASTGSTTPMESAAETSKK